ncbi:cupin-like domain-containing protein [Sphingomonas sp. MMS24-JH45]
MGEGTLFYDEAMEMNFRMAGASCPTSSAVSTPARAATITAVYLGSVDIHDYFDGLHPANHVPALGDQITSIWIGTKTRIAAHNDNPDNLACVAVGRRRFTLFPARPVRQPLSRPGRQHAGGPRRLDGQLPRPDFDRHPRFREALAHAGSRIWRRGTRLRAALWWHHVEGLADFNVLVNYWWRNTPRWLGHPQDALNHAMLAIRDLSADEKTIGAPCSTIMCSDRATPRPRTFPRKARRADRLTPETAARLRGFLLQQLSR